MSSSIRLIWLALLAGLLLSCATTEPPLAESTPVVTEPSRLAIDDSKIPGAKTDDLELFPSELKSATELPAGWEKWILHPLKRRTEYGWKKDRSGVFLEAKSRGSASGIIKRLDLDPAEFAHLQFSWMIDSLLEGADVADRDFEDSPVRIVLAFDGDKSSLSSKDLAFMERVKTFTGQDLPYASLMYIWDNKRPLNTVVTNPHSSRIKKFVASTGKAGLKTWQMHRRNIVNDYRTAFGKEPGKLIGIAIMTDTDNTKTYAQAQYRGLRISKVQADVSGVVTR
jgi:hypothetical protein